MKAQLKKKLDFSEEIDTDLVLLLTHQEGFTYENYIGAFDHHIINEFSAPVLSITTSATAFKSENFMKPIPGPAGYPFKNERNNRIIKIIQERCF